MVFRKFLRSIDQKGAVKAYKKKQEAKHQKKKAAKQKKNAKEQAEEKADKAQVEHEAKKVKKAGIEGGAASMEAASAHGEKERGKTLEFLKSDVQGLTPKQRASMQQEAHQSILRQEQGAHRRLLGQQGQRGISGKSGIAYSQQRELQKLGQEARQRSDRDLYQLEADQANKVKAAAVAAGKGGEAQYNLATKEAEQEKQAEYDRKRERALEKKYNNFLMTKA